MAVKKEQVKQAAATYVTPPTKKDPDQPTETKTEEKKPISFYVTPSNYEKLQNLARFRAAAGEKNSNGQPMSAGTLIDTAIAEYLERNKEEIERWETFIGKTDQ